MLPVVRRTWGLRGQTPILRHRMRHYSKVSAIGALTVSAKRKHLGAYLHLYPDADICQEAVVAFLRELLCHLRGVVVLIWDRWNVHRGKTVRGFLARHPRLQVEYLPPYAPELNPQEQCWTLLKYHRLGNHGITELDVLEEAVGMEFRSICTEQHVLHSFLRASRLPIF